ncbi:hypothetical protein H6G76_12555 [Nostoc sp. FACHB-152]|nr:MULTISPECIES: hypothetical protein [unclassified Nostoc]MBD2447996.1 hypothetical protein [Nostoc sp. FACHB-152]MBD2466103.1 hypothetical protein [Nostoc sp. FACHB-145]
MMSTGFAKKEFLLQKEQEEAGEQGSRGAGENNDRESTTFFGTSGQ